MKIKTLVIFGLSAMAAIVFTGCATGGSAGKVGPDYDDPMTKQIRLQEAQSRVTRSFIR